MYLTLIRHGDAEPDSALGDVGRVLSSRGRAQARATGEALASRGVAPTVVWCSPLVRAVQTAELITAAFERDDLLVRTRADLYPHSETSSLLAALACLPDEADVLAVGHQPYMGETATALLGLSIGSFATGAAFRVRIDAHSPLRAELEWRFVGRFVD